jgi:hypothetical protein
LQNSSQIATREDSFCSAIGKLGQARMESQPEFTAWATVQCRRLNRMTISSHGRERTAFGNAPRWSCSKAHAGYPWKIVRTTRWNISPFAKFIREEMNVDWTKEPAGG